MGLFLRSSFVAKILGDNALSSNERANRRRCLKIVMPAAKLIRLISELSHAFALKYHAPFMRPRYHLEYVLR
jgi:hypothetical protein